VGKARRASGKRKTTLRCGVVAVSGADSRQSKNNRQESFDAPKPRELPGPSLRPVAVREGTQLRDEARCVKVGAGETMPLYQVDLEELTEQPERQARATHQVLTEWRSWMRDYQNSHIEFNSPDGETVRAPLENSYQKGYSDRYYARLCDFERGVSREFDNLTTVMLTFTASHRNKEGRWRCPADHMRDVIDGWDTARKQLYHVLDGYRWEYARILEPHQDGYGHLHIGVAVDTDGLPPQIFRPVMESYVQNTKSAGSDAHSLNRYDLGDAVSVNNDVDSLSSYLAEYIGLYKDETALERPWTEQMFYAVTWSTNSRRVDFSNGAQEIIADEQWRRETGLRPEDRGSCEASEMDAETTEGDAPADAPEGSWTAENICRVSQNEPNYYPPEPGGRLTGPIDGRPGADPPKFVK